MQIKNTKEYLIPYQIAIIEKSISKDVGKLEPLCIYDGNEKVDSSYGKQYGVSKEKIENRNTVRSSHINSRYLSKKKMKLGFFNRYLHAHVNCSTMHNSQSVEIT